MNGKAGIVCSCLVLLRHISVCFVTTRHSLVAQVCFADKILLNKIDLVTDEQQLAAIEKKIRGLNPTATIQRTSHSKIDPRDFLDIGAFDLKRVLDFDPEFLDENAEHEHDATVSSVAVKKEGQVNKELLERWIERLIVD